MRDAAMAAFLVFAGATASAATDLPTAIQELEAAVDARIAAIGSPGNRESKNLAKARATLGKYAGGTGAADLKLINTAAKQFVAARTQDPAIRAAGVDVIDAECDVAKSERADVVAVVDSLVDSADVAKANALLARPDDVLAAAKSHLSDNPILAQSLVVNAYGKFAAAKTKADKFTAKETGAAPPPGVAIVSSSAGFYLTNSGKTAYVVKQVRVFGLLTATGAADRTFTGENAKTLIPDLYTTPHSGILDPVYVDSYGGKHPAVLSLTQDVITPLLPAGASNIEFKGRMWITFVGRKFFSVPFDFQHP
jgi:hypothetical protein